MKKSILASLLVAAAIVYSCNKDVSENNSAPPQVTEKTNEEKLIGKWSMTKASWNDYYSNTNHYDSATYPGGLYQVEFKKDTVISWSTYSSHIDTAFYKIFNDSKIVINQADTAIIKTLTDSTLQLYYKDNYQNGEAYEEWQNYIKKQN